MISADLPQQEMGELGGKVDRVLVKALIEIESRGNLMAIGDKHLKNKAYGPLQIRQPAVDDVNRVYGTKHKAQDMLGNLELSVWIFQRYMEIYATEEKLGRPVTDVDRARIWNGGPNGWRKASTVAYGKDYLSKVGFA